MKAIKKFISIKKHDQNVRGVEMKVDVSDNVTLRIPNTEISGQIAPIYLIGLPDDILKIKELLEEVQGN